MGLILFNQSNKEGFVISFSLVPVFFLIGHISLCSFGIRYIAKVLRISLQERFPDEPEEDIIKVRLPSTLSC